MRIVFWNLNKQRLKVEVQQLAVEQRADLLILGEDVLTSSQRLASLNSNGPQFFITQSECPRISIYTAFSDKFVTCRRDSDYYTVREVRLPAKLPFLLVALHWKSQMWRSEVSQDFAMVQLAQMIRDLETEVGFRCTIVAGDFNVEPYYNGMTSANGLHAVMCRKVAQRIERKISPFGSFAFFYNPMWSIYGDECDGPPGTYYRSDSQEVCQFWHIFDQYLVRPDLIEYLPNKSVAVVTELGDKSLLDMSGHPALSDHLPIVLEINLPAFFENQHV